MNSMPRSVKMKILYEGKELDMRFPSIREAARFINEDPAWLKQYIKKGCGSYKHNIIKVEYDEDNELQYRTSKALFN